MAAPQNFRSFAVGGNSDLVARLEEIHIQWLLRAAEKNFRAFAVGGNSDLVARLEGIQI